MTQPAKAQEPSMEEILASIRRIIADDDGKTAWAWIDNGTIGLMLACAEGRLAEVRANWADDHALTVVMAAKGYPGTPEKGGAIRLPDGLDAMVFHAGTAIEAGQLIANGGRVLNVTARGSTVTQAQAAAYAAVDAIDFPTGFCRRDIGWREVAREKGL